MTDVQAIGKALKSSADHFAPRNWDYTRNLGDLKAIRYAPSAYDKFPRRVRRAFKYLTGKSNLGKTFDTGLSFRLRMVRLCFQTDPHLPDGVLDDGKIITFWEEDGEYLQSMQPMVGSKVADFLYQQPTNPYAIAIAEEIERLWNERTDG